MAKTPPLMDLHLPTADSGFYKGFARNVAVTSKIIITILVIWAVAFPESAGRILNGFNSFILSNFASWYTYVMASFVLVCLILAIWPASGRLKMGLDTD